MIIFIKLAVLGVTHAVHPLTPPPPPNPQIPALCLSFAFSLCFGLAKLVSQIFAFYISRG